MQLPERIFIGVAEWWVLRKKHPRLSQSGDAVMGWERMETQTLCVSNTISDVRQIETFCHEVLHALMDDAGLHEQSKDHTVIDPLTISFMNFLMQNDLSWLNKYFKEKWHERYG